MSNQKQHSKRKTNKLKKNIDLLCLIANESTAQCRKFLVSKGVEDAVNHADLEYKLAQAYAACDDKPAFEMELAKIHPHKNFILKYLGENNPTQKTAQPLADNAMAAIKEEIVAEPKANACGCSGIDGYSNCSGSEPKHSINETNPLVFLGVLTIAAATLIILSKNQK